MYIVASNEEFFPLLTHPQGIIHSKSEQNETLQQLSFRIKKNSKQTYVRIWCKNDMNKSIPFQHLFEPCMLWHDLQY